MVLSQKDDSIQHKIFHDLPEFLEPGDLLVVNNSKVLPARIVGVKQPTGAVCELLLLRQVKGRPVGMPCKARQADAARHEGELW